MRQLCNVAYSAIVEWMDERKKANFDRELLADDPSTVSHGSQALMSLMMGGARR